MILDRDHKVADAILHASIAISSAIFGYIWASVLINHPTLSFSHSQTTYNRDENQLNHARNTAHHRPSCCSVQDRRWGNRRLRWEWTYKRCNDPWTTRQVTEPNTQTQKGKYMQAHYFLTCLLASGIQTIGTEQSDLSQSFFSHLWNWVFYFLFFKLLGQPRWERHYIKRNLIG